MVIAYTMSALQSNGWTSGLLVGMSTSCPGRLDLLGMRRRQVGPAPRSLPELTHKTSQAQASFPIPLQVKEGGFVLWSPWGAPFTQILLSPIRWHGHRDSGFTG